MRAFKIRFYLASPLLYSSQNLIKPLQGDGIYGYAWAMKNGLKKAPSEHYIKNIVHPELPFETENNCYAISAGFADPNAFFEETLLLRHTDYQKSFSEHGLGKSNVAIATGEFRGIRDLYWKLITPYIEFYARGNIEGIKEFTEIIIRNGYLSSKRAIGYGKILNATITKAEEDWSLWRNDQPTRNIPVIGERRDDLMVEKCGYRPPYWHPAFWKACYVPPVGMHLPALPKIETENIELRKIFWADAVHECAQLLKKQYPYIPNLQVIKFDMFPLRNADIPIVFDLTNKNLLRQYLFLGIYNTIAKAEAEHSTDFERILKQQVMEIKERIESYDKKISLYEHLIQ